MPIDKSITAKNNNVKASDHITYSLAPFIKKFPFIIEKYKNSDGGF